MARLVSPGNHGKLIQFWKKNRVQASGNYFKRLVSVEAQGGGRAQTESLTVTLSQKGTTVVVTLTSGEALRLECAKLSGGSLSKPGRELAIILDGNGDRAGKITKGLEALRDGGGSLVVTHATVELNREG